MKDKVIMSVNHTIFCGKQHHTSLLVLYFYELCCLDFVLVPNFTLCPTNLVNLYPLFRFCLSYFLGTSLGTPLHVHFPCICLKPNVLLSPVLLLSRKFRSSLRSSQWHLRLSKNMDSSFNPNHA